MNTTIPKLGKRFKCRQAVFTIQKGSNQDWKPENLVEKEGIKYISGQWEKAPKTGTIHFQGYVQFTKQHQSRKSVMALLGAKCWCANARGSLEQNQKYVSKTDWEGKGNRLEKTEVFEWGVPEKCDASGKGSTRKDLEKIRKSILNGDKMLTVANENFSSWCGSFRAIAKYKCMVDQQKSPDFRKVKVEVYFGDAGANKSRRALDAAKKAGKGYYRPVINNQGQVWFSNYNGEGALILDDFYGQIRFSYMLRLLDGYRMEIETKGGSVYAQWNKIYITSNVHPKKWWRSYENIPPKSVQGIIRRITNITFCEAPTHIQSDWVDTVVSKACPRTSVEKESDLHPCKRQKIAKGPMKCLLGTKCLNGKCVKIQNPKWSRRTWYKRS